MPREDDLPSRSEHNDDMNRVWSAQRASVRPPTVFRDTARLLYATRAFVAWAAVGRAMGAHEQLVAEGIRSRVVSMPSWDIFEQQTQAYQESVLPPQVTARVAVEQASTFGWERYVGRSGHIIGMHTFGASAPLKELQRKFGFEPDRVAAAAKAQLGRT